MIISSKAPLRIGLAGGGTDVSPYSDDFGGAILNSTINLHVYTTIQPSDDGLISLNSLDLGVEAKVFSQKQLKDIEGLSLPIGVYNRLVKDYNLKAQSFKLTTYVDVPKGSGLGTSSTITVSILGAFLEWFGINLTDYETARLAYKIEREDLKMAGGKQDQYAATFGGVNFMEFQQNETVIVNPLRVNSDYMSELEHNLILYYTGTSRLSAAIIENQSTAFKLKKNKSIEAAHKIKQQAIYMKTALLTGDIDGIGRILDEGWQFKKEMAAGITNDVIDNIYSTAKKAGAIGGKISGAGGGGYMTLYCPGNTRYKVSRELETLGGKIQPFSFDPIGLTTWTIP